MTKFLLIATAAIAAATGPAFARDAKPADTATTEASRPAGPRVPSSTQRYCIVEMVTGSLIPQRTCKTRADWMRDADFDPLAK